MKKNIKQISITVVWLITIVLSFYIGMVYHWASTTELEMSKDYNEIIVEENEVADYTIFIEIPKKYGTLEEYLNEEFRFETIK